MTAIDCSKCTYCSFYLTRSRYVDTAQVAMKSNSISLIPFTFTIQLNSATVKLDPYFVPEKNQPKEISFVRGDGVTDGRIVDARFMSVIGEKTTIAVQSTLQALHLLQVEDSSSPVRVFTESPQKREGTGVGRDGALVLLRAAEANRLSYGSPYGQEGEPQQKTIDFFRTKISSGNGVRNELHGVVAPDHVA